MNKVFIIPLILIVATGSIAIYFNKYYSLSFTNYFHKPFDEFNRMEKIIEKNGVCYESIIYDEKANKFNFREICDGKFLIFRFPESFCSGCIEREFENIRHINKSQKELEIIVITSFKNTRDYYVFLKYSNLSDIRIVNCNGSIVNSESNFPYYLLLNGDLKISKAFIPRKESNKPSVKFLNSIH